MNRSGFAECHFGRDFTVAVASALAMFFPASEALASGFLFITQHRTTSCEQYGLATRFAEERQRLAAQPVIPTARGLMLLQGPCALPGDPHGP
jgi:hypothetical protein